MTSAGFEVKLAHTIMLTSVSGSSLFLFMASMSKLSASGYRPSAMLAAACPFKTLVDASAFDCPNSS